MNPVQVIHICVTDNVRKGGTYYVGLTVEEAIALAIKVHPESTRPMFQLHCSHTQKEYGEAKPLYL